MKIDWEELIADRRPYMVKRREIFARNLRREIKFANQSLNFIEMGTGIAQEELQKYLNGEEFPSVENLLHLCSFLHVTTADLLGI